MKKNFLLVLICAAVSMTAQEKKSTIKGTVLYDVPLLNSLKPDVGATVTLHKSNVQAGSAQDTLTAFRKIVSTPELFNATTPEKFKAIDAGATAYLLRIKKDPNTLTATVDATGNYSVALAPGRYEIIIQSIGISSYDSTLEKTGVLYTYFIEVKAGETKIQDQIFKPYFS
jgi:hypothetical protein